LSGLVHEGLEIQTPSELSFTPLPEILPQEDAVLETEKEVEMPEEDEETLEAEAAVNRPIEEDEEEEEEEFEDEEVSFLFYSTFWSVAIIPCSSTSQVDSSPAKVFSSWQ
jgi:hypothetical protein